MSGLLPTQMNFSILPMTACPKQMKTTKILRANSDAYGLGMGQWAIGHAACMRKSQINPVCFDEADPEINRKYAGS